jgi:hypothetical protein
MKYDGQKFSAVDVVAPCIKYKPLPPASAFGALGGLTEA